MDLPETLRHIERLAELAQQGKDDHFKLHSARLQVLEFLKAAAGERSQFYKSAEAVGLGNQGYAANVLASILGAFRSHLEAGLHGALGPERKAQLEVVSDFLEQAQGLLSSKSVHPAAPTHWGIA